MSDTANSEEEGEEPSGEEEEPTRSRQLPTRRISFSSSSREVGSLAIMPEKEKKINENVTCFISTRPKTPLRPSRTPCCTFINLPCIVIVGGLATLIAPRCKKVCVCACMCGLTEDE